MSDLIIPKNGRSIREEFERQIRERNLKWPIDAEAWRVDRFDDPEFGAQVTCVELIEAKTLHTPEQVREWGNKIKTIAANEHTYNVAVFDWTNVNEFNEPKVVIYPRKVPRGIGDITKTTDQRLREKVQQQVYQEKVRHQGIGDFDKKPELTDFIEDILDDNEDELDG